MVKWSRLALLIAVVSLFCFMFAGAAFAIDANITITADGQTSAFTGCQNSYIIDVDTTYPNFIMNASCFNQSSGINMYVSFRNALGNYDSGFTFATGMTIPVKILITDTNGANPQWLFAQPTLTYDTANFRGVLQIPNLQISNAEGKMVKQITIGDNLQNLKLTNPCLSGNYCLVLALDPVCSMSGSLEKASPLSLLRAVSLLM